MVPEGITTAAPLQITTSGRRILVVLDNRSTATGHDPTMARIYLGGAEVIRLGPGRSRYLGTALPDIKEICLQSAPSMVLFSKRDPDLELKRSTSRVALELAVEAARRLPRPPRAPRQPRHGFQQAARLPCFRGVRRR